MAPSANAAFQVPLINMSCQPDANIAPLVSNSPIPLALPAISPSPDLSQRLLTIVPQPLSAGPAEPGPIPSKKADVQRELNDRLFDNISAQNALPEVSQAAAPPEVRAYVA